MEDIRLGVVEARFADIIWQNAPLTTRELVKLCEAELDWKRTTTYTVLKRLCDRGLFRNQDGAVTSIVSKDEFAAMRSESFVDDAFEGSLPAFLAAFSSRKKLSDKEIDDLQKIIDGMRG